MWPTDFFNALSVSSFILCLIVALLAARTATRVQALQDRLTRSPVSRIESLEESHAAVVEELHNLANRVKMMKVRRAADHIRDDEPRDKMPDPHKDPDAWRTAMNSRLARAKLSS